MSHRSVYVLPGAKDPNLLRRVLEERGIRHQTCGKRWKVWIDGQEFTLCASDGQVELEGWEVRRPKASRQVIEECIQRANYLFVIDGLRRKGFLKERERVGPDGEIEVMLVREVA